MAIGTISTYAAFQSTLSDVSQTENTLNSEQEALSSGNAHQSFADMPSQVQQYLSLNTSIARSQEYLNDNQVVETTVNSTSSALDQVISTGTSLMSLISQSESSPTESAVFQQQIQATWQSLAQSMNTSINGQYVFSGTKTDSPAVNASVFPNTSPGVPNDAYYLGSSQDLTVQAQDDTNITYNVRGNSQGFQDIIAGLSQANQSIASNDTAGLQTAYSLVQKGVQEITNEQASVNAVKVQMSGIDSSQQSLQLYWKGIQESIGNTDIVSVSTQVAVNQGILQAAFEAFSKITSLSLADFLK